MLVGVGVSWINLHSVQDDKVSFVLHNRVLPSLGHLGDTVDTSGEDG